MKPSERIEYIKKWIVDYCKSMTKKPDALVIGVSGGIDSSVTSTICAKTDIKTILVSMPIKQNSQQHNLSLDHQDWLSKKYPNVKKYIISLDNVFENFEKTCR